MLRVVEEALTYDDVLLVPAYSEVLPKNVELKTRLTKGIQLNIPIVSAAMDTVTEGRLAIAMAQEGAIGIIHKNLTPEEQAEEVRRVKKYESGIVSDPVTCTPDTTVGQIRELSARVGFSGFPVVDDGELVGIVTSRDVRFESDADAKVYSIMTPKERLVTVREDEDESVISELLRKHRIEKILMVDDNSVLQAWLLLKI